MKNKSNDTSIGWRLLSFDQVVHQVLDFRGKTPLKLGMNWGGSIPALSANNVKKGYIDFESECHMASEELYSKWMNKGDLKKGDIVFTMEAPLGNVAIIPDNKRYLLSQRVVAFRFSKEINNLLMYHYLLSDIFQGKLNLLATGSTAKGINQRSLSRVKFLLPSLEEQSRIVSILETWDRSIENLEKKIETKKQIKKGLMRDLLTGKKRLKGFNGKWSAVKLGEIATFKKGKSLPKKDIHPDAKYEAIHYGELFTKYGEYIETIISKTDSIKGMFLSKRNDILMPTSDVTPRGLSTASYLDKDGVILGGDILVIRSLGNLNGLFFCYLVTLNKKDVIKLVSGSTIFHLYGSDMAKFELNLPPLKEQESIIKILVTADKEITELEKKLSILKEQKRYLLNNLITGKIRTPETLSAKLTK